MTTVNCLFRPFRRFRRDEYAGVTIEAVMILPILLWGYFGMFILFDAYRAASSNIRAGYTISDMLSREVNEVNSAYIEGLNDIQDVLTQSPHRTVLRTTFVSYDANDDAHTLEGSYSTAGRDKITEGNFQTAIVNNLPPMPHTGWLIVVETWVAYVPFMNITIEQLYQMGDKSDRIVFGPFYFENLTVIRPRFAGQMTLDL